MRAVKKRYGSPLTRIFAVSAFVALSCLGLASGAAWAGDAACDDPFDLVMDRAAAEWPYAPPTHLSPEWVEYFVLGYNNQFERGTELIADTVIAFPLEPDDQFIVAFYRGCMTLYVDLTPNKAHRLLETGYVIANRE